jgi:adenylate cyclase
VLGASFSRIAEAQSAVLDELMSDGEDDRGTPAERLDLLMDTLGTAEGRMLLAMLEDSVLYVWRRHLLAALSRWAGAGEVTGEQAVAFADVSNFSGLTKSLGASEISRIVDAFESTAFDVVAAHDGRVVKLIGDEVMFVAEDLPAAVDVCLELVDRAAQGPDALQLHCGVAFGPTVSIGGDVFGPTANLASRLTDVARRGRVVIPRDQSGALTEREDLVVRPVRRSFDLKGFGRTRMCTVARRTSVAEAVVGDRHGNGDGHPDADGDADGAGR